MSEDAPAAVKPSRSVVPGGSAGADGVGRWAWRLRHTWVVVALSLMAAGVAASLVAGSSVARDDAGKSRKSFERASGDIASTLQLAIDHQNDLVVNAAAFVADAPSSSQAAFVQWTKSAQVLQRYPELQGLGVVFIVPASGSPRMPRTPWLTPRGP